MRRYISGSSFERTLFFIAVFFLTLTNASAQTATIERLEIVGHGLYAAESTNCSRDERGLSVCDIAEVEHTATTTRVPAQIGILFGVSFRIVGAPDTARVNLRKVWILPPGGLRAPINAEPIRRIERMEANLIGATSVSTYGFDEAWELVPGVWTLEFWDGDRRLLSQQFEVVAP